MMEFKGSHLSIPLAASSREWDSNGDQFHPDVAKLPSRESLLILGCMGGPVWTSVGWRNSSTARHGGQAEHSSRFSFSLVCA